MNTRPLFVSTVFLIASAVLLAGVAGPQLFQGSSQALASGVEAAQVALQTSVPGTINYQGRLTNPDGVPLDGTQQMRFQLYDMASDGALLWDSGTMDVKVDSGLFNVPLPVDGAAFTGQALWLQLQVNDELLSPRQELLPVPYALSLRPGARIVGEPPDPSGAVIRATLEGNWPAASAVAGINLATGTAGRFESASGFGVSGYSAETYGVWGESDNSSGGYFASNEGYGIRATTAGTDHWDHAGYFTAENGYGIYAQSAQNMAIRGEAGDIDGLWQPVGTVGVTGIGQSRGVYGSGGSSYGIYATSLNWYGIYGRTSRSDHNYGLYTPDNLYARNIQTSGAMMQVVQNGGSEPLEPGDVAVFSGMGAPLQHSGAPVLQVAKATTANNSAVAGVVYSRFDFEALQGADVQPNESGFDAQDTLTPAGPVAAGSYLLLVVQGPVQVKVDALTGGGIQPGDLLSTSDHEGHATRAAQVTIADVPTSIPGTVLGKALEPVATGQDLIYVFVTLQ